LRGERTIAVEGRAFEKSLGVWREMKDIVI